MPHEIVNGNDARRQRTRQALIDSAERLFEVKGYAATTVAEIAQGAKVSERTFYVHFPAKEDLLFAHVRDFTDLAWRVAAEQDSSDPVERTRAALLALIDAASADEHIARHARSRAALAVKGHVPRALAAQLMILAKGLSTRIAQATGAPLSAVVPIVGAAIGAVEAAGILGAHELTHTGARRDAMTRALNAALHGFQREGSPASAP